MMPIRRGRTPLGFFHRTPLGFFGRSETTTNLHVACAPIYGIRVNGGSLWMAAQRLSFVKAPYAKWAGKWSAELAPVLQQQLPWDRHTLNVEVATDTGAAIFAGSRSSDGAPYAMIAADGTLMHIGWAYDGNGTPNVKSWCATDNYVVGAGDRTVEGCVYLNRRSDGETINQRNLYVAVGPGVAGGGTAQDVVHDEGDSVIVGGPHGGFFSGPDHSGDGSVMRLYVVETGDNPSDPEALPTLTPHWRTILDPDVDITVWEMQKEGNVLFCATNSGVFALDTSNEGAILGAVRDGRQWDRIGASGSQVFVGGEYGDGFIVKKYIWSGSGFVGGWTWKQSDQPVAPTSEVLSITTDGDRVYVSTVCRRVAAGLGGFSSHLWILDAATGEELAGVGG